MQVLFSPFLFMYIRLKKTISICIVLRSESRLDIARPSSDVTFGNIQKLMVVLKAIYCVYNIAVSNNLFIMTLLTEHTP